MHKLATVILHYGDVSMTQRLYRQLAGLNEHVFVFDNNAPQPFIPSWKRSPTNLYWTGAFSACVKEMQEQGFSHLWFLNNDILFTDPTQLFDRVATRHQWITRKVGKIGIYSPAVTHNPYHAQMICRKDTQFARVAYIDGIAPLVSLAYWQETGGLDAEDNVYGYGVDVWLSLRAGQSGWNVIVDHQVVVRHTYHSTASKVDGYLQEAGKAEHLYLTKRMGSNYRKQLEKMAQEVQYF